MRPLLVSLALLMLALCRQSAGGISYNIESFFSESSKTSVSLIPKEKQTKFTRAVSKPKAKGVKTTDITKKLFNLMPNTIILSALYAAEVTANVPFLTKSLYNGVLCDFETATSEKFNQLIYSNPAGDRANDEKEAKEDKSDGEGYECSNAPQTSDTEKALFKCFCTEKKALLYCSFLAMKEHFTEVAKSEGMVNEIAPKPCRDVTVPALVASGHLGKEYDMDQFSNNMFEDAFNGQVDSYSTEKMKAILCDALNPIVENAVRAVYASDGLYWITEGLLYTIIFGPSEESLTEACMESDFKYSLYGKCVCKEDTGFAFCIFKVIAQAFWDAGYLKCDGGVPTFDAAKKPSALPQLAKPKGRGGASGDNGGNGGNKDDISSTASSASSPASTSFSLVAPAAAAAMLLLLRQ